jgi:HEAT repeat protein
MRNLLSQVGAPATGRASLAQLIAQLLDPKEPLAARRAAARALAKDGSDAAMQALKQALQEGPVSLKAAVAEALGGCPNLAARQMLLDLASGADETTARGALRGLATRGDAEAAEVLAAALFDEKKSVAFRTEAALALGTVQQAAALAALTRAVREIKDETLLENVFDGLGRRPFTETEAIFREFLQRSDVATDSRVAALEALGNTPENCSAFLLDYAADADPNVRAAVGWALTAAENPGAISPQLLSWLQQENDASARLRLYQALANQEAVASSAVLPYVQRETDAEARLAGLGLLAATLRADGNAAALGYFESTAVAELRTAALNSRRLDQSLSAIMALDRAGTPAAMTTLNDIAQNTQDTALRAAAQQAVTRHRAR